MVFPLQGALAFVGLLGLPRPDVLYHWTTKLMSKMEINLPGDPFNNPYGSGGGDPYGSGGGDPYGSGGDFSNDPHVQRAEQQGQQALVILGLIITAVCVFLSIWSIANVIGPFVYKGSVTDNKPEPDITTMKDGEFHYGLMECFSNTNECLCSCCCPLIRFADTHSSIGGFWGSFCACFGANLIIGIIGSIVSTAFAGGQTTASYQQGDGSISVDGTGDGPSWLIEGVLRGLVFGLYFRKNLRARLGDPNPSKAAFKDFLAWGFCSCCALTQESVEADIAANVTISCPCTLTKGRADPRVKARAVAPNDLLGEALLVEAR